MRMLAITFVSIVVAVALAAAALWLKGALKSASWRSGWKHIGGFSVFDLQVSLGAGAESAKREAALYLTLKTSPADPHSAAKLLFGEKVRRLGE